MSPPNQILIKFWIGTNHTEKLIVYSQAIRLTKRLISMLKSFLVISLWIFTTGIFLISFETKSIAQNYISLNDLKNLIEIEITKANEIIEEEKLPRYKLTKVEIEISVSVEALKSGKVQIPVLPVKAEIGGEYTNIKTSKNTYHYQPKDSVPVGKSPKFGLQDFVLQLHRDLKSDMSNSTFVVTRADHEMTFVIRQKIGGGFSFFDAISLGANKTTANTHRIKFSYCLVGKEDGKCADLEH
jgi:hypothetical protein